MHYKNKNNMELKDKYKDYKLCYVSNERMYFTSNFDTQWGDDWNDAPYEHNAEPPYKDDTHDIVIIAFDDCLFNYPNSYYCNSPYSVEMINHGAVAWLFDKQKNIAIEGGIELEYVINLFQENKYSLYFPLNIIKSL